MLHSINRLFLLLIILAAATGIFVSIITLFFLNQSEDQAILSSLHNYDYHSGIHMIGIAPNYSSSNSPYSIEVTLKTPYRDSKDLVFIEVYSSGKLLSESDCLSQQKDTSEYSFSDSINCTISVPYTYSQNPTYSIFARYTHDGQEYIGNVEKVRFNWSAYENDLKGFYISLSLFIVSIYLLVILPVTIFALYTSLHTKHAFKYSFRNLINPFSDPKTIFGKVNSFLVSPYFWSIELSGVIIILLYMSLYSSAWTDTWTLLSFLLCGAVAFVIPYLWCIGWWYADYKQREPLRIIVTFFFWGMLASLMAIGVNSISGEILGLFGIGFIGTLLAAPIFEELFKGSGLSLLSEHQEFNSVEDGIIYGFAIGMGFSFIENWLYFIQHPLGSDIVSWIWLVIVRSIIFSANHGFYTAISGAIIGYLIERKFSFPALGILIALPFAAFLHAMHNSSEILTTLFGSGGILLYCCLLVPLFDYGGALVIIGLFIRSIVRKK
jgi:RsiW-degrading membrane proteinase PrsW (M82 family)